MRTNTLLAREIAPIASADRTMFLIAAAFNFLVASVLVVPGNTLWEALALPATQPLVAHLLVVFIALFGATYAWIGIDPDEKNVLVLVGAIGKLAVVLLITAYYLAGEASFGLFSLVLGDLVFVVTFLRFWAARRA